MNAREVERKRAALEAVTITDFGLWGGLVPGAVPQMAEMAAAGVMGFKAFMCDSGLPEFPRADDRTLLEGMKEAVRLGLPVAVHAESQAIIKRLNEMATTHDARQFLATRPLAAEVEAVERALLMAKDTRVKLHLVHMGAAATPVVTMGDISKVFVRGKVDETEIGNLRLNQPARITVETFKERTFQGKVTQISPMGVERDNVTNFEVRVSIDNPGSELKANMTANAEIVLEERPNSLIVPEAAIIYDAKRVPFVDVLDHSARGGRRRTPIKIGISNGTRTQVLEGLREGEKLVLPS